MSHRPFRSIRLQFASAIVDKWERSFSLRKLCRRAKDCSFMWITNSITVRTLTWLAASTMAVGGLPAASCGCSSSKSCCEKAEPSELCRCSAEKVREGRCCRGREPAVSVGSCCWGSHQDDASRAACCKTDSVCTCAASCQCGKAKQSMPSTPPVKNTITEKVANDLVSATTAAIVYQPQITQRHVDASSASGSLAAMDRCASLCRFTL